MQKVGSVVSVSLSFDSKTRKSFPRSVVWNGKLYAISRIGLHHTYRKGRVLYHVFSVVASTLFLRLVLNTENLQWNLEEVQDRLIS